MNTRNYVLTLCVLVGLAFLAIPATAQDDDPGLRTSTSWAGGGAGIVEIAHPSGDPCATSSTPGCLEYGGNTAWHDANVNGDYYISGGGGDGSINRLSRYIEATGPDQFEIRFTASGGLGVYAFSSNLDILAVPFEIWNIGDPVDGGDDERMIPFIVANEDGVHSLDWTDMYTGVDSWNVTAGTPITDWIYGMMPDRAGGYSLFEAAALGFGGAGATYDPAADGDVQVDPDPFLGGDCANQGYYVDFCYQNQFFFNNGGTSSFIYPIGRVVFADLAGDGTTPETDTVVRLIAEDAGFPNWAGNGAGIVESAHPTEDPCAGGDPGCADYFGNTVWHDSNVDSDFYVSGGGGDGSVDRLRRYVEVAAAMRATFEIRFTEAGGYGVYGFGANTIVSVPFELWAVFQDGSEERGIPFINNNDVELSDWTDMYTGTDSWGLGASTPITDWIYGMVADRPGAYDMFEAAAIGFGGAGATYDPLTDGDDQVDLDPSGTSTDGVTCDNQGYYVNFCWLNTVLTGTYPGGTFGSQFVYPVGRVVIADLIGDGTTPSTGTVISMYTNKSNPSLPTGAEDSPEIPQDYLLYQTYPNPFNPQAVVPFYVPEVGTVRVAVYDILGREVAVLVNGQVSPGHHEVVLDGSDLASGVYVIRMVAAGSVQAATKVLLLR